MNQIILVNITVMFQKSSSQEQEATRLLWMERG